MFKSFADRVAAREGRTEPSPSADRAIGIDASYRAFGAKDKTHRLDVRCENGLGHSLAYAYLVNITYDRRDYSRIFLTGSGLVVTIKGRALRTIVDALKLHTCEFIQAFDAREFERPADSDAAYVESIAVEVLRGPDVVAEASKAQEAA